MASMIVLVVLGYGALAYKTLTLFLAIMALLPAYRAGKLSRLQVGIFSPILLAGVVYDFTLNLASSLLFWELPRWGEWMLTWRCERHLRDSDGWRYRLARWICFTLLDPFQVGGHCHRSPA